MSTSRFIKRVVEALAAVCLTILALTACKPDVKPAPPKPPPAKTNSVSATNAVATNQSVSVFQDLLPPKGIDPFYPDSHRREPVAPITGGVEKPPPAAGILLKGIVGSGAHRLAVIGGGFNNSILEANESGSVRVASGSVRVKCLEVGDNFARVLVEGESQPRKLELKKGF